MAIIRCPYCHAIIDENDKYCNNCGTQLLFSEDEEIEEEIPGEKIIEAETEEKDYTVDEPESEKRPATAKDLDSEIDEDLEQELKEEPEEMALDELVTAETEAAGGDVTEEVILVDEIEAAEAKDKKGSAVLEEDKDEKKDEEEEDEEEELADELEEELEEEVEKEGEAEKKPAQEEETRVYAAAALRKAALAEAVKPEGAPAAEEPDIEYLSESAPPDEASTAGESALKPITFDTKELESIGRTVELSKEKVDKFIEVLAEKKPEQPAVPEPVRRTPTGEPATGSLPPWASTMKGAPVFPEDTGPVETRKLGGGEPATADTDEEVEIFPRRRDSDSTIGLPERVSQAPLPFEPGSAEEEEGVIAAPAEPERRARPAVLPVRGPEVREPVRHEIEAADEGEEAGPRPPFSFSVFFKSKAFDLLFVGLFWLVALWLAASSMGMTLFEILGAMSGSMLLLYAVFVLLYFFLFKFFLGETLGDRLFRPRG